MNKEEAVETLRAWTKDDRIGMGIEEIEALHAVIELLYGTPDDMRALHAAKTWLEDIGRSTLHGPLPMKTVSEGLGHLAQTIALVEKMRVKEGVPDGHYRIDADGNILDHDGAVLVQAGEVLPNVIHIMDEGLPACAFSREVPGRWPPGHRWISRVGYRLGAKSDRGRFCDECVAVAGSSAVNERKKT
jgi:hypothetical protein